MLCEIGVRMVLVGHSERRQVFAETDDLISQKVTEALERGLVPILCVGETLDENEKGKTNDVLRRQLKSFRDGIIIAYEPVWAIGTGKTATTAQIVATHKFIKSVVGEDVTVLYGGSVNENNAGEILSTKGVDGVLVGGASLCPDKFAAIVNS